MTDFFAFLASNPSLAWGVLAAVVMVAMSLAIIALRGNIQTKWFALGGAKLDLVFDYAEFVSRLHDQEYEAIHHGKERARLETRRSVDHIAHKLVGINHEIFNLSQARGALDAYDARFNVTVNGQFKSTLVRECMEIFEANHLAEMDARDFDDKISRDWDRILQKARMALMADWIHVEYSFDTFEGYLAPHLESIKAIFAGLIYTYRALASSKSEIKERVREQLRVTRAHVKAHGKLPEGCEDIICA